MRWRVLSWLLIALAATPTTADETLPWQRGWEPLNESSPQSSNRLIISVITNDDPTRRPSEPVLPWCDSLLQRRFDALFERRPDLADRLSFQAIPAGRPPILTGGEMRMRPRRLVMAICDPQFRLLTLSVGLPDSDTLHDLIEDAEEVSRIRQAGRSELQKHLATRSSDRLPRRWAGAMQVCLRNASAIPLGSEPADANDEDDIEQRLPAVPRQPGDEPALEDRGALGGPAPEEPPGDGEQQPAGDLGPRLIAQRALADLAPVYQQDVQRRYDVAADEEPQRLAKLEQHTETRRPWCEAILPSLVALDWESLWHPVVSSIWRREPFRALPAGDQLLDWFRWHADRQPVALKLTETHRQTLSERHFVVAAESPAAGTLLEDALAEHFQSMPYRTATLEQLAMLMEQTDQPPIDVEQPSPARYVIFAPSETAPLAIRAGDSPKKWRGRIRRLSSAKVRSSPP